MNDSLWLCHGLRVGRWCISSTLFYPGGLADTLIYPIIVYVLLYYLVIIPLGLFMWWWCLEQATFFMCHMFNPHPFIQSFLLARLLLTISFLIEIILPPPPILYTFLYMRANAIRELMLIACAESTTYPPAIILFRL